MINQMKLKKILVIDVAGIGDMVMATPSLRALRTKYPQAYIVMLVVPRAAELFKNCPYLDDIFCFDIEYFKKIHCLFNVIKTFNSLRAIFSLRSKQFDCVINLYRIASLSGSIRMRVLLNIIKPKMSVGRNMSKARPIFSLEHKDDIYLIKHEVEASLATISLLGLQIDAADLELWPNEEDEQYSFNLLNKYKCLDANLLVGINPNAFQRVNLWFEDRFAKVADSLIQDNNAQIIFFGSKSDERRIECILSHMNNKAVNLSGKLTLNQYVSLLKRLNLFITLDSGPMHLASVFKIPTVALFGAEEVRKFGPYGNPKSIILQKKVNCKLCNQKLACKQRHCMDALSVDEVVDACKQLV